VLFDPYQAVSLAQRLAKVRVPMEEFAQSVPNLSEVTTNLFELVRGGNLRVYPAADLRQQVLNAITVEGPRGIRLAKEKSSKRIDLAVALSMAALAAVRRGNSAIFEGNVLDHALLVPTESAAEYGLSVRLPGDGAGWVPGPGAPGMPTRPGDPGHATSGGGASGPWVYSNPDSPWFGGGWVSESVDCEIPAGESTG
jgi:hypothetical protein